MVIPALGKLHPEVNTTMTAVTDTLEVHTRWTSFKGAKAQMKTLCAAKHT